MFFRSLYISYLIDVSNKQSNSAIMYCSLYDIRASNEFNKCCET